MDYEQMEIDITLESDRDLKENMQATAKFALGQIMEYQHPTKVKNRHEGYGIAAEGYASLQGKMKSTKTDMDDLLKLLPNGDGDVLNVIGSLYNSAVEVAVESIKLAAQAVYVWIMADRSHKEYRIRSTGRGRERFPVHVVHGNQHTRNTGSVHDAGRLGRRPAGFETLHPCRAGQGWGSIPRKSHKGTPGRKVRRRSIQMELSNTRMQGPIGSLYEV